jgi:hypothetical protein
MLSPVHPEKKEKFNNLSPLATRHSPLLFGRSGLPGA